MDHAFIKVASKRHDNDCAVACLVMLLGVSYEAALLAIAQVDPHVATNGLFFTQLKKVAKRLGFKLKSVRKGRYSLDESTGILGVKLKDGNVEHAVILFRGTIIDPEEDGVVWDSAEAYFEAKCKKVGSLLTLE
jgi:ABC-type bacteriocin/lantibiotic exporter with double-glycine peptidase domain